MKQLLAIAAALLSAASLSFGIGDPCGPCGSAITLPASQVTTNSAALNGWVNPNGSTTTVWFQWGATTNYGNIVSIPDLSTDNFVSVTSSITNLTPHQLYNYRVVASNSFGTAFGDNVSFSADFSFTPGVATLPASQVTTNSATLNGWVNPNGSPTTNWFQWGTTTNYVSIDPDGSTDRVASVASSITNLAPYQSYNYRLVASNTFGVAFGSNRSFPAGIPQLAIDPHPNTDTVVVVRWPAAATNWVLESTTNLADSASWSPWPDPPNVVSNQNTVAIPDPWPERQGFFRLHQQ